MKVEAVDYTQLVFNPKTEQSQPKENRVEKVTSDEVDPKHKSEKKAREEYKTDKDLKLIIWQLKEGKKVLKQVPLKERIEFAHYLLDYLDGNLIGENIDESI